MSIVTKKGDKGVTSLRMGGRVWKDDPRIELCGTLDELCSFLGLVKAQSKNKKTKKMIEHIQKNLLAACSGVSAKPKLKKGIDVDSIVWLEENIRGLESGGSLRVRGFCIPGDNFISGAMHVARTIARRAERHAVTLKRKKMLADRNLLVYLNRLSDFLFLLAKECGKG